MNSPSTLDRIAIIAALAKRWPLPKLGHTALMKAVYFLQTICKVPLGYRFRLRSYGPYDSDVLNDLDIAETFDKVKVEIIYFPGGYEYEINPLESSPEPENEFIAKYTSEIDWVVNEFSGLSVAELELASTAMYADREFPKCRIDALVERVAQVKPCFPIEQVRVQILSLHMKGVLSTVADGG